MSEKPRYRASIGDDGNTVWNQVSPGVISVSDLPSASSVKYPTVSGIGQSAAQYNFLDGDKFPGGFGATKLFLTDYWTLRRRSAQLFNENIYARGMIRRLVTNIINTGLTLEAFPDEGILGMPSGALDDWAENVENRFNLWANDPRMCDFYGKHTFYQLEKIAKRESLIVGDILVIMRQDTFTKLPQIQLVSGERVRTPSQYKPQAGHSVKYGVETDAAGREVAYHIALSGGKSERIPAKGPRTGRHMAWLVYGTDKRMDECRGQPLLSIVLQSLKEIDRYRDSAQRKAVINSMLAMFIKKDVDKMGTRPLTGGATRRDAMTVGDTADEDRRYDMIAQIPGITLDELQVGETPQAFGNEGIDINFPAFEEAIIASLAWALEVPPEILRLAFSNNYSASQAAINEFKTFLNSERQEFGKDFCQPVYSDWLLSEVLLQKIDAPRLLDAWRDRRKYDIYGAWVASDWTGSIKPSTDIVKTARGQGMLIDRGLTTHSRAAAETTGTSFNRNVKRLRRENELMVEAMRPIREFEREFGDKPGESAADLTELSDMVDNAVTDALDDR